MLESPAVSKDDKDHLCATQPIKILKGNIHLKPFTCIKMLQNDLIKLCASLSEVCSPLQRTYRRCLHVSIYFNADSVCIHRWYQ